MNQYEQFLTEEENECLRNIERNINHLKRVNVTSGLMGKGLLRLNRNPEFTKYVVNPLKRNSTLYEEQHQQSRKNTPSEKSKTPSLKSTPYSKKTELLRKNKSTPIKKIPETVKEKKDFIDQKNFVDDKILEKIKNNRFLNKRLLNNQNIFNILINPIIKISKKKYYNNDIYYRNGILKKKNIGKILYSNYVIKSSPFKNYFKGKGHNIFSKNLFSTSSDYLLHQPYSSKHEYSTYNNIFAKKLTYIRHNYKNCKIRMKSNDVVRIEKPAKALIKWNDQAFSRIPTISKKVHYFDANKYLFELNDSILTNEEEQIYECCPKKYDSVCYRKNLYKLQKEILNNYIKESTATMFQKYPNIGGWGNLPDDDTKKIKESLPLNDDDNSTEEEENKELNMNNIYPKDMTLDEYLRMYEEMLENKKKKPNKNIYKNHVIKLLYITIIYFYYNSIYLIFSLYIYKFIWIIKDSKNKRLGLINYINLVLLILIN